jgi:hypothetical protein
VTGQQRMLTPPWHLILRICRRSVLPYTRFCICFLDYDYVLQSGNFCMYGFWQTSQLIICFVGEVSQKFELRPVASYLSVWAIFAQLTSEVWACLETSTAYRVIQSDHYYHVPQVSGTPEGCHWRFLKIPTIRLLAYRVGRCLLGVLRTGYK